MFLNKAEAEAAAHRPPVAVVVRLQVEAEVVDRPAAVAVLRAAEADAAARLVSAPQVEIPAVVSVAPAGARRASAITEGQAQVSEERGVATMGTLEVSTRADAMAVVSPTATTIPK